MNAHIPASLPKVLTDGFGRRISYVRLSVTDRCDLRCTYCMSEHPTFLPRSDLLSFEEMERLALLLIAGGVERLRVTGGEPLVRKGVGDFLVRLGEAGRAAGLKELTLTTNGTLLERFLPDLVAAGIRRINVSCDSLRPEVFRRVTRGGDLDTVLGGMAAAQAAGLRVKLNVVALQRDNRDEIPDIIAFAHARGMDVSLIETMPLGDDIAREAQFVSLTDVMAELESFWTLAPVAARTAGPARYYDIAETGGRLGLITPLSHNFCDTCNRVRVTCTGRMYMCLGQDDYVDFRPALRGGDDGALREGLDEALRRKPRAHDFAIGVSLGHSPSRTMSLTGG